MRARVPVARILLRTDPRRIPMRSRTHRPPWALSLMFVAVAGHGKVEGPFTEIDDLDIERDDRYPARVRVQFYAARRASSVASTSRAWATRGASRLGAGGLVRLVRQAPRAAVVRVLPVQLADLKREKIRIR